jgi:hypothetical protein
MPPYDDLLVRVHGSWNGWRSAEVKFGDIHGAHWLQPSGAPHPLVHGFVECGPGIAAQFPHECDGNTPHYLRVCVLKRHVISATYAELVRRADAHREPQADAVPRPSKGGPTGKAVA